MHQPETCCRLLFSGNVISYQLRPLFWKVVAFLESTVKLHIGFKQQSKMVHLLTEHFSHCMPNLVGNYLIVLYTKHQISSALPGWSFSSLMCLIWWRLPGIVCKILDLDRKVGVCGIRAIIYCSGLYCIKMTKNNSLQKQSHGGGDCPVSHGRSARQLLKYY